MVWQGLDYKLSWFAGRKETASKPRGGISLGLPGSRIFSTCLRATGSEIDENSRMLRAQFAGLLIERLLRFA